MNTLKRVARTKPGQRDNIRVIGIDPSLSSTGFSYKVDGQLYTGRIDTGKLSASERLVYVRKQIEQVLDHAGPTLAVYEDYAMGTAGKNNNAFHIGELGGILKAELWERGIDVMLVAPACLKKTIVGNGNADRGKGKEHKPEMRAALKGKFGYDIEQNDEADAFALMLVGEIRFIGGLPEGVRKQLRLDALRECTIIKGRAKLKLIANE